MKIFSFLSLMAIPMLMTLILLHGWMKRINIYEAFIEGAGEGFKTAIAIMPYLVAIFIAIGLMRRSGALDTLTSLAHPLMTLMGIPSEVLPLAIMRPISGSGSLGVLRDLLLSYGPDSFIGRVASTMMGSAETIFYTMAVYFGAVGVKKGRHTVAAALLAHLASIIASVLVCTYFFM